MALKFFKRLTSPPPANARTREDTPLAKCSSNAEVASPDSNNHRSVNSYINRPFPHLATAEDIYYCFRLILGRNPNPEEWRGHVSREGTPLSDVVASYTSSLEYKQRKLVQWDESALPKIAKVGEANMYVRPDDQAVGTHILYGSYEPNVTAAFHAFLRPGMHVVDIGANIGYFSILAASLVGVSGKVHSIEPNPNNAKLLECSRLLNSFDHLSVLQIAAGRQSGMLVLNTAYSNGTTSDLERQLESILDSITVPSFDLDTVLAGAPRLDFIKADVEGAEFNALVGASDLISRFKPVIVSEFAPSLLPGISQISGEDYLGWLLDMGYKLGVLEIKPKGDFITGLSVSQIMDAYHRSGVDHIDILALPD